MRISDWSSDVCSSDLRPPAREHRRRPRLRQSVLRRGQGPRRWPHRYRVPGPAVGAQSRLPHARGEIGRASCRERVCTYVSISVVADNLKKTNLTKLWEIQNNSVEQTQCHTIDS